jgi:hypothetical protein
VGSDTSGAAFVLLSDGRPLQVDRRVVEGMMLQHLRSRGIVAVIPEPSYQQGHRECRGSKGGRRTGYDVEDYEEATNVERSSDLGGQWRGLTRYDQPALTYRDAPVLTAVTR